MKKQSKLFYLLIGLVYFIVFQSVVINTEAKSKKLSDKQLIMFMNYPYQIWSNDPTKIHLTLLKQDFTPAHGAAVTVDGQSVGRTDENGVCIFDFRSKSKKSHKLTAAYQEQGSTYKTIKTFSSNARTVSFRADKLYVYTDRGIYNPGQNILIRIMAWQLKGEYTPLPGEKIQLLLQDKHKKVFSGEYVQTNDFGIAATRLAVPENMPEGDYQLEVLFKKARESASIRVKRFKPPLINIKHNLKRYLTDTQKSLNAKIELGYFTGSKLKSSRLSFSIHTHNKREIFRKNFKSDQPVYQLHFTREELNSFRGKLALERIFKIKINAEDSYGQKDEITWDITYTERPYTTVLEIDKDAYQKGEKVQILAKIVDLDMQPAAQIPIIIEIPKLNIKKESKTDKNGVAVLEFTMSGQSVTVFVKSPDVKKALAKRTIPYQKPKPMISKVSEPPKDSGARTVISVTFDPDYIPVEKIIHVDFTDISGALVMSTTIPVSKGNKRYSARGEVTAPTWGTMLVNLYCCAIKKTDIQKPLSITTVGFITEGQHITFYPDKDLEIHIENFRPSAAPGEQVNFRIQVKGGTGEKCLGVSLVDDAVVSLLDPFIKPPVSHFYNPQAKVISTGGSGVLTWPVVDRNWGSPWRDIAYSNWGWKSPGAFVMGVRKAKTNKSNDGATLKPESYMADNGGSMASETKEMAAAPPAMAGAPKKSMKRKKKNGGGKKPAPVITIRKHFPETALWEPQIITKNKAAKFSVTMPDSITTQKLSILASDKEGYIGLMRKDIKVTQPLFIKSTFPAAMVAGDKISAQAVIRNLTDKKISCNAVLKSDDLKITGNDSLELNILPGETKTAEWNITGKICGKNQFAVSIETFGETFGETSGETPGFKDIEEQSVFVRPAGEPHIKRITGEINKQDKFKATIYADKNAAYRTTHLNVSMPNVFPAIQAWWAFDTGYYHSPWATSAAAIMNTAMLEYALKNNGDEKWISTLRLQLEKALAQLISRQMSSGAWGWYFLPDATAPDNRQVIGGENLYYTISVIRALAEIRGADLAVDDDVLMKAINYILKNRNKNGLWSAKNAYFWEVFNDETDLALSTEIFEVLMLTASRFPKAKKFDREFKELKEKMLKLLREKIQEPMTISAASKGLLYWAEYKNDNSVKNMVYESIDQLISLKRKGYWEPHWYHAYGGMVELNARILELLAEVDPGKYDSYLREGMTWLLSTREAWGAWHNEIGTANAIRALLKSGAFAKEKQSSITITINGKQAANITVDPDDPYLSAAKLRFFEITKWITPGTNHIEVSYNGNLTGSVILEQKEWSTKTVKAQTPVKLERLAPVRANLGEPVSVKLSLTSKKTYPMLLIQETIPANADAVQTSLDQLIREKKITNYKIERNRLYLYLVNVKGQIAVEYKLNGLRKGKCLHPGTRVVDPGNGKVLASIISSPLEVK